MISSHLFPNDALEIGRPQSDVFFKQGSFKEADLFSMIQIVTLCDGAGDGYWFAFLK